MRALALLAAAVPFVFGLIRLAQTGNDARYLVVATASLCGAAVAMKLARTARLVVVFVAATMLAVAAAMLMGTRFGPGILVVAAAFGFCFAAASAIHLRTPS